MIFKDYYKILNLDTNKVTESQIKIAFREQAKKYHPDINNQSHQSEERFKDINEAYKVLSNSSSKRKYDRMWNSKVGRKKQKEKYDGLCVLICVLGPDRHGASCGSDVR